MRATRLLVSGIVQGVGYRFFTERAARSLSITGYVRNLRDGRVEVVACCTKEEVQALIDQLRLGPAGAKVDGIVVEETDLDGGMGRFEIRS
jgi:acylphosphatase